MTIRYSAALGGFYHSDVHATMPADAVGVSTKRHAALIAAQAAGGRIVADSRGRPVIAAERRALDQVRAAAIDAVRREARRRILAISSLERQSNDNAAIALAALRGDGDTAGALTRRAAIDAVRTRCEALRSEIARMSLAQLDALDAAGATHWKEV